MKLNKYCCEIIENIGLLRSKASRFRAALNDIFRSTLPSAHVVHGFGTYY